MKNIAKRKKQLILFAIIAIGIFFRFFNLGNVPPGVTNDEASYIYNAYSIWKTGHDITGSFLPLSINLDNSFSPVPMYLIAPIVGIFGISPTIGRLLNAFMGVFIIIVVYKLVKLLFTQESVALSSAFVIAIMPWHIHFSRIAYDGPFALFFYLLGIFIFLKKKEVKWIIFSFICFTLGFYSYHATKLFIIAFFPLLLYARYTHFKEPFRHYILYFLVAVSIVFSFLYVQNTQDVDRGGIFIWKDLSGVTKTVNDERKFTSILPGIAPIFSNKATTLFRLVRENYLEAYSPHFLFLYGEVGGLSGIYGTYNRGVLYLIELPLLLLGISQLYKYVKRPHYILLLGGFLFAGIPSALAIDKSYAVRSIMMIPFLAIFIGIGITEFTLQIKQFKNLPKYICYGLFIVLYLYGIADYGYQYFSRYPVYSAESWLTSSRDLYSYISNKEKDGYAISIVNPGDLLIQFAVYGNLDPELVQKIYTTDPPKTMGNITFVNGCIDTHKVEFKMSDYFPEKTVYITEPECHPEATPAAFIRNRGEYLHVLWKIFEEDGKP